MKITAGLTVGLILVGLASPGMSAEPSQPLKDVIAAANKEGALKLSWGTNSFGGAEGARRFEQAINARFGTNIRITYSPGPDLVQSGFQVATEAKAGRPASTDVLQGVHETLPALIRGKTLRKIEWQKLLPDRIQDNLIEADGMAVRVATQPYGITYNTQLLPTPPRTIAELLDPRFKGKILTTTFAGGFSLLAAKDVWGRDKSLEYMKAFSQQAEGLARCSPGSSKVASGEFAIFALDCGPQSALELKEKGLPIDVLMPEDYVVWGYTYLTVPVNAQHPNAATLFSVFALTEEGQALLYEVWNRDLHLFPGSRFAAFMDKALKTPGAKLVEGSATWIAARPEIEKTREAMVRLLRSK
jgi:iron(III) transport system substrate-binding protein